MANLKVLGNQGIYKGTFAAPVFELLESSASVRRELYNSFHGLGYDVPALRFDYNAALPEQYIAIQFRRGNIKFLAERVELNLTDFVTSEIDAIPGLLQAAEAFIRGLCPDLSFQRHEFMYYAHAEIEASNPTEYLSKLPSPVVKSAGNSLGTGFNFLWDLPELKWRSRLALDHSLLFPTALFFGLTVEMEGGMISYPAAQEEVRAYLRRVLSDLDLTLPIE